MINIYEVNETNNMIEHEKLDVRTITLGISLLDCVDSNLDALCDKIYRKITSTLWPRAGISNATSGFPLSINGFP